MLAGLASLGATAIEAQEWVPFPEPDQRRPARNTAAEPTERTSRPLLAPMDGRIGGERPRASGGGAEGESWNGSATGDGALAREALHREPLPPLDEKSRAVDRGELPPAMANDGSGLPHEMWRGLDAAKVEALFAALEIPPRSPALAALWRRLMAASAGPGSNDGAFAALRVEALDRSGLLKEAGEAVARMPGGGADALAAILTARNEVALGRRETACEAIKAAPPSAPVPRQLKDEAILISGYCAVAGGNTAAAGLVADLAREHGMEPRPGLVALDAIAAGTKPEILVAAKRVTPLDYRLLVLAGGAPAALVIEKGTAATLVAVANDGAADAELRLAASEAAARLNAIGPRDLAASYRAANASRSGTDAGSDATPAALRRAALFAAAADERTPLKKTRQIRAFLDEARRSGLYLQALEMMADTADTLSPTAEIGWFAESAIEIALSAGRYQRAREWALLAGAAEQIGIADDAGRLAHWQALADIADPDRAAPRGNSLVSVERLAHGGRMAPELLHRLTTVLDALDTHVPIPLWDAASRTPQPSGGHLPETGVLSELLDASKKRELGRTVLLAMQTLGPSGAEGAHMIALGDAIRALKRAGLAAEARRLGFEALFASWPRMAAL